MNIVVYENEYRYATFTFKQYANEVGHSMIKERNFETFNSINDNYTFG